MAKEKTNPKDPRWSHYYAKATIAPQTLYILTWTCPDCKTMNRTSFDPTDEKVRFRSYKRIVARCGHCHGNVHTLTDSKGWTIDPDTLTHA